MKKSKVKKEDSGKQMDSPTVPREESPMIAKQEEIEEEV